jgi:hypothetical protein
VVEKDVRYNDYTISLPNLAPKSISDVTIKKAIFDRMMGNVKSVTKKDWDWKLTIVKRHFEQECPGILVNAKMTVSEALNTFAHQAYTVGNWDLYDENQATPLNKGPHTAGVNEGFTDDTIQRARWIGFALTLTPRQLTVVGTEVRPQDLPGPETMQVFIRVPLDAAQDRMVGLNRPDLLANTKAAILEHCEFDVDHMYSINKSGSVTLASFFECSMISETVSFSMLTFVCSMLCMCELSGRQDLWNNASSIQRSSTSTCPREDVATELWTSTSMPS